MTGGCVVVIGKPGRNFGAGMSGGIAYVYDPHSDFDRRVNYEMVDVIQLDADDRTFLRDTLERHVEFTGSTVAERMLTSWEVEVSKFRKVMPTDYKRVLQERAKHDEEMEASVHG